MGKPVNPKDGHSGATKKGPNPEGSFKAAGANVVSSSAKCFAGKGMRKSGGKGKMYK